jgi:hypothetical protein
MCIFSVNNSDKNSRSFHLRRTEMLLKKRTIIIRSVIILIVSFCSMVFGQEMTGGTPETRAAELRNLLDSIEGVSVEPPRIHLTKDGYLRFIMAPQGAHFGTAETSSRKPEEIAEPFLEKWRGLLVSESSAVVFDVIRITTSDSRSYLRYQQKYAGLEVSGANDYTGKQRRWD